MICPVSYPSMIDRESKSCRSFCPDTTGFFVFASTPTIDREPKKVAANDMQSAATMEVPPRFELGSQGFADPCLTTWPRHHMNLSRKKGTRGAFLQLTNGAGDEARTRYLHLGKVALYQMSYTRICRNHYSGIGSICQVFFAKGRNFLRYGSVGSSGSGTGLEG